MLRTLIHPTFGRLSRYADGELDVRSRRRIARHLAHCVRCRERLGSIREIDGAARALASPALPSGLLERILVRAESGEEVILPMGDVPAVQSPRMRGVAAAAVVALALGGLTFFAAPNLEAEKSELRFSPERPRQGETVHVEYRATGRLDGEERLALRARVYTARGASSPFHERLAELERTDGRTFRGSFRLADSVGYAVLAVEDLEGRTIDHNGEMWEILAHGDHGRPLWHALQHKIRDLGQRNTQLALETARRMTRLYPDRIGSWDNLYIRESAQLGRGQIDSLQAVHRVRLPELIKAMGDADRPTPEDMASVVFYAERIGDEATARSWRDRLIREYPAHPSAVQQRVFAVSEANRGDPAGFFSALERLWEEVGDASPQLRFSAFMNARVAKDAEVLRRWGKRMLESDAGSRASVARAYMGVPELRHEGVPLVREYLRELASPREDTRPLTETVEEQRARYRRSAGLFLGMLGQALIEQGRVEAGLDTLSRAIEATWNVDLFRTVAQARLAAGDTAGALPVLARVAADPGTGEAFADSVRQQLGVSFRDPMRWRSLVEEAYREMRSHVLVQSTNRPVRGKVRLSDASGRRHAFEAASEGGTLVAFWSRYCPPSIMQLKQLHATAAELERRGVRVITITDEEPSPELDAFLKARELHFPVLHDADREARHAFDTFGSPAYLVLDSEGRIRFESRSLADVGRQFAVLSALSAE